MTSANYTASADAIPLIPQKPYAPYNRKLVQGVGVNDYPTPTKVNGKDIVSYRVWHSMLVRCYSANYQKEKPTYIGCSVIKDWQLFSNFERWFSSNYVVGGRLDKDLLFPGNKVYSAETCVFVSPALNSLLLDHGAARGTYPIGVHIRKDNRKYTALISAGARQRSLGCFSTALAAHQAWQLAKADIIANFPTTDLRVRAALDLRVVQLRDDYANNRITVKL